MRDSQVIGVIIGFLAPALGFVAYALIYTHYIRPHLSFDFFVQDMFLGTREYQSPILSLSMIALVPFFFYFNHQNKPRIMKGMLTAMFILAALIVVLWF
jgi:hypothetical protein